ncbi:MAG: hypothetical protein LBB94_11785, partial [Clostridiales bacterium]|nr:hypothetical protein [Clostridiales bacterium]
MDKCGLASGSSYRLEGMQRYVGQTVTIFTASGGLSGNGFTGVLIRADDYYIHLLTSIGAPPACPLGSACGGGFDQTDSGFCGNPFGSLVVIPINAIV